MNPSDSAPTADPVPLLRGLDPEKLLAAALRSSPVTLPSHDWEPPPASVVNGWFPEYEVDRLIGRGAMGAVYHAVHSRLGRDIAIKLLPAVLAQREEMAARFEREARALAKLSHPNIVGLHDFGRTESGHLFIVMEHVAGADLSRLIRGGDLSVTQALEIIGQVCDALQYAHGQGFVHRDIKPGNILVDTTGRVRIADFGLTKLLGAESGSHPHAAGRTLTGAALGTPEYTAPEQLRGGTVDHRADIYSLGVMLYEMLTGDLPRGAWALPSQRSSADIRLDEVVTRAMQTEPDKRYQQASEVKTAINAPAPVPGSASKSSSWFPAPAQTGGKATLLPGNVWLAVIFFACAVGLAAVIPEGHLAFTIQICAPVVLVGLWFLSRQGKPAAWHGLLAGLTVGATAVAGLHLPKAVKEATFVAPARRLADQPAEVLPTDNQLNQSKAKAARILSSIRETVTAQEDKVAELRAKLALMRKEYGIVDTPGESGANAGSPENQTLMRPGNPEYDMKVQLALFESQKQQISGLSGEAAFDLVDDDETIRLFRAQWQRDKLELARMLNAGYGERHPRILGLKSSISKEQEILNDALQNYRSTLEVNMKNLRQSLAKLQGSPDRSQAAPVSPEKMKEYADLKIRYELAVETLRDLNRSATQLTMGALGVFQQEVDRITRDDAPAATLPEPPIVPALSETMKPSGAADKSAEEPARSRRAEIPAEASGAAAAKPVDAPPPQAEAQAETGNGKDGNQGKDENAVPFSMENPGLTEPVAPVPVAPVPADAAFPAPAPAR